VRNALAGGEPVVVVILVSGLRQAMRKVEIKTMG
jgi:hypothetical protein